MNAASKLLRLFCEVRLAGLKENLTQNAGHVVIQGLDARIEP